MGGSSAKDKVYISEGFDGMGRGEEGKRLTGEGEGSKSLLGFHNNDSNHRPTQTGRTECLCVGTTAC